jgi:type III secretory pathway lipoprotein EscJ
MRTINKIVAALLVIIFLAACNKNYYSGSGKGGKNCGCPSQKGMSGY